jgi:hypothetical protein
VRDEWTAVDSAIASEADMEIHWVSVKVTCTVENLVVQLVQRLGASWVT